MGLVEVFSHSQQTWCPGRIQAVTDNEAMVMYFYPDMPQDSEPVIKNIPIGHEDMRLMQAQPELHAELHENFTVGTRVDVYSNSMRVWCPGQVVDLHDDVVVVSFHYPDM